MKVEGPPTSPMGSYRAITGSGAHSGGETCTRAWAFLPHRPTDLDLSHRALLAMFRATEALARLDGAAHELPDPALMVRPLVRREAVATSALEGTYSSLDEVLAAEVDTDPVGGATGEVVNYVRAAERGLERLRVRPIGYNLLNELHGVLMAGVRGDSWAAGRFRDTQNYIGRPGRPISEASHVLPPPELLDDLISDWERWIHDERALPLVRVALGHWYFEVIHPYADGNGRMGRLVVVLQLVDFGLLSGHLLSVSPWLEARRDEYLTRLGELTRTGDVSGWVTFFCTGLAEAAESSLALLHRLIAVRDAAVEKVRASGRRGTSVRIAENVIGYPVMTASGVARAHDVSYEAANRAIAQLVKLDVLTELTGGSYGRVFASPAVLEVLR